ncbi:MAG: Rid family detoxifying hydrolase [Halobacteriales archaeon]|nr:Rid family detoxifying hydrolase [Halobacteriales archaeon]
MKRIISSPDAPAAVGAYSQATTDGDLVFTAGQIALTADGDFLDDEPIGVQTRQALENVKSILEEEGLTLQDVLKVTVFLGDIDDYDAMNDAYSEYFQDNPPARSAFAVGALPKGAKVEIEAVAANK